MKKIIEWDLLRAEDIEVRPAASKNGKTTLLLYQDSRCTMRQLDKKFGSFGWEIEYKEVAGKIYGKLSIYDADTYKWISKEDTGEKSNISEEKGLSSDILKRCAVRWGLARELYTAPRIIVNDDGYGNSGCKVSEIQYDSSRNIIHLVIKNKFGTEIFRWDKSVGDTSYLEILPSNSTATATKTATPNEVKNLTKQSILESFCKKKVSEGEDRTELGKFFKYYFNKDFKGQMMPDKLWANWKERAEKKQAA